MSMRKAVIFARVSNQQQAEDQNSLNNQVIKLNDYAKRNNYEIIKEFRFVEDLDLSKIEKFPDLIDFLKAQQDKIFVICYSEYNAFSNGELNKLSSEQKVEIKHYCHPCFPEPKDPKTKVWRYISLPKLIDLLQTKTLFFTRADFLRKYDKSEGSRFTKASLDFYSQIMQLKQQNIEVPHPQIDNFPLSRMVEMEMHSHNHNETNGLKQMFVNCWHMNEDENFAMWKVYSENFGVCIQSTYQDLCDSFEDEKWGFYSEQSKIYVGEINYVDWNTFVIPSGNFFWPYLHKKKEFRYEQELRCVVWNSVGQEELNFKVKINPEKLINKIYVNPFTPSWFRQSIENLCQQYGIPSTKVEQSILA